MVRERLSAGPIQLRATIDAAERRVAIQSGVPITAVATALYRSTSIPRRTLPSNTQSTPVVKVAQSDLLRLRMPVLEEDVPFIKIGGDVQIKLQDTGKVILGKIIRFTRELTESTRTMLAEVDVKATCPVVTVALGLTSPQD